MPAWKSPESFLLVLGLIATATILTGCDEGCTGTKLCTMTSVGCDCVAEEVNLGKVKGKISVKLQCSGDTRKTPECANADDIDQKTACGPIDADSVTCPDGFEFDPNWAAASGTAATMDTGDTAPTFCSEKYESDTRGGGKAGGSLAMLCKEEGTEGASR